MPELEQRLPVQVDQQALDADPLRHRFTLVFDREGCSPSLFRRMKDKRIARLSNGLWLRELTERDHQTAILCTDYRSEAAPLAMAIEPRRGRLDDTATPWRQCRRRRQRPSD